MNKNIFVKALFLIVFGSLPFNSAKAVFPYDLSDVIILEVFPSGVQNFAQTVTLNFSVSASPINSFGRALNYVDNRNWRASIGTASCCNANAWFFAQIGGRWYGATTEYLRVGQSVKSESSLLVNHFQGLQPIASVPLTLAQGTLRNGVIYGFMTAGITRPGLAFNTARERSNVSLWRWGVGPAAYSEVAGGGDPEPEPEPEEARIIMSGMINMLLEEEETSE